jgi:hypothetical protein
MNGSRHHMVNLAPLGKAPTPESSSMSEIDVATACFFDVDSGGMSLDNFLGAAAVGSSSAAAAAAGGLGAATAAAGLGAAAAAGGSGAVAAGGLGSTAAGLGAEAAGGLDLVSVSSVLSVFGFIALSDLRGHK